MPDLDDLRRMRADEMAETTCSAEVTRDGDADVCYLPATGWAWGYDEFSEPALYRACVHHDDHTGPVAATRSGRPSTPTTERAAAPWPAHGNAAREDSDDEQ